MKNLLAEIRGCQICSPFLINGVNPVLSVHAESKIVIIGQAPGRIVHKTGIPWDDKSGDRLRDWLGVDKDEFYNNQLFAILPMGFCYPGKGRSGDLPPRSECAPQWHNRVIQNLKSVELTLLIGKYAQDYYLGKRTFATLTANVRNFNSFLPNYLPLPHPSPRNNIWLKKNPWFIDEVIPRLREVVEKAKPNSK